MWIAIRILLQALHTTSPLEGMPDPTRVQGRAACLLLEARGAPVVKQASRQCRGATSRVLRWASQTSTFQGQ